MSTSPDNPPQDSFPRAVSPDAEVAAYSSGEDLHLTVRTLKDGRQQVLRAWLDRAAREPFHLGRESRAVADHIPALFDSLIDLLEQSTANFDGQSEPPDYERIQQTAVRHAQARLAQGLNASEVMVEFRTLRQELTRALQEDHRSHEQAEAVLAAQLLLNDALDIAMTVAVNTFSDFLEREKDDVIAITAHDLRTPLTAVRGLGQLVQRGLTQGNVDAARLGQHLDRLIEETDHMARLIEATLDAARVAAGGLDLDRSEVDLLEALEQVIERLGEEARTRVKVDAPEGTRPIAFWDRLRIQQLLQNLLSNSLKYAPTGDVHVQVQATGSGKQVLMTVSDHGIGLSEDEQQKLFERHYRSPQAVHRKIAGSGLGLFIAKAIVDAHGGSLSIDSPGRNQGVTVTLVLPTE